MRREHRPPRAAHALLERCCAPRWLEEIEGDLAEQFVDQVRTNGVFRARWTYWRDVLLFLSKSYLRGRRNAPYQQARSLTMLTNYLKTTLRTLRRQKGYSLINIGGLSVGMACGLVIFLFIQDEFRYDTHHHQAHRIYRVVNEHHGEEGVSRKATTPPALGPAVERTLADVQHAIRFYPRPQTLISYEDRQFVEEHGFLVDPSVFDIFSFPLLQGDPKTALVAPHTIVLARSTARKYFGEDNPVGRTLTLNNTMTMEVTGVMEDQPAHTHLPFSYLGSFATLRDLAPPALEEDNWRWQDFFTYVLLSEGATPEGLHAKLPAFIAEHATPHTQPAGYRHAPFLQRLTDIHLHSGGLQYDIALRGSYTAVQALGWIAVLMLLIACFNFINLATARSTKRAKEVGIRKTIGAHRFQLIKQFLSESILLAFLSLLLALSLVLVSLPWINQLFEKSLTLHALTTPWLLPGVLAATLGVGLLAGGVPAVLLSAFQPIAVLKGIMATGGAGLKTLRKTLVIAQFTGSILLVIATLVVFRQLAHLQESDLGFNDEQLVLLPLRGAQVRANLEAFKAALVQHPSVRAATAARGLPGDVVPGDWVHLEHQELPFLTNLFLVDYDYLATLEMEMVAGRAFSRRFPSDAEQGFIVNETAARELGWRPEEALGKTAWWGRWGRDAGRQEGAIIGVVKDFNFRSLHQDVEPVVMTMYAPAFSHVVLRLGPENMEATLHALEQTWERWVPDWPFAYRFLDEQFAALYQAERKLGRLFLVFSAFAILVAGLGLFGLAAFTTEQRTKEIGIRKVLGASASGIVLLLSREFLALVLIGFTLAAPLAYLIMERWLTDFAYRIDLSWRIFLMAGLAALLVAVFTVSYQAIKTALVDPVKSLRYE